MTSHIAENLKSTVLSILSDYDISIEKVYTCTSDNGRNIIKMSSLLQEEQEKMFSSDENESDSECEIETSAAEDIDMENEDIF